MTRRGKTALCTSLPLALSGLLALTACGPLVSIGGDSKPPTLYTLTAPEINANERGQLPVTLIVDEPAASDALDSRRIALMPSDLEVQYYAGIRWTDRAPKLIQSLLVSSFKGQVANVSPDSSPVFPNYRLTSRLVSFENRYSSKNRPVATVGLELQLYSVRPVALVASTRLTNEQPASADKADPISRAFNTATHETVKASVSWSYDEMAKHIATTTPPKPLSGTK